MRGQQARGGFYTHFSSLSQAYIHLNQQYHAHDLQRDAVLPAVVALRRNLTVLQAVSNILSSYDAHFHQQVGQGKTSLCLSGRYNLTDTSNALFEHLRV